jgi:hypothetical protein
VTHYKGSSCTHSTIIFYSMDTHLNERIRYQLCKVNELRNGQMKDFEIKTPQVNSSVLLIRQNDQFYAYANKCCHYKLPLIKGLKKYFFFCLSIWMN